MWHNVVNFLVCIIMYGISSGVNLLANTTKYSINTIISSLWRLSEKTTTVKQKNLIYNFNFIHSIFIYATISMIALSNHTVKDD